MIRRANQKINYNIGCIFEYTNRKVCNNCKIIKLFTEYSFYNKSKNILKNSCKSCLNQESKEYMLRKIGRKIVDRPKILINGKTFAQMNDIEKKLYFIEYRKINSARIKKQRENYRTNNKEKIDALLKIRKAKYKGSKMEARDKQATKQWRKDKREKDPFFRLLESVSSNIRISLKSSNIKKNKSSAKLLGLVIEDFFKNLENQFEPWMTWENRGIISNNYNKDDISTFTWQPDHIIPQCAYILSKDGNTIWEDSIRDLWSSKNLRPLESKANNIKRGLVVQKAIDIIQIHPHITQYLTPEYLKKVEEFRKTKTNA